MFGGGVYVGARRAPQKKKVKSHKGEGIPIFKWLNLLAVKEMQINIKIKNHLCAVKEL